MDLRIVRSLQIIGGLGMIGVGSLQLFLLLTGRAWNCPQPSLFNVSRTVGAIAFILIGIGVLLVVKSPRLSLVFTVPGTLAIVATLALALQTRSASCAPTSGTLSWITSTMDPQQTVLMIPDRSSRRSTE